MVWVCSPAGSGKTALVSSYLDSRKVPCLWYRCDEGDSDLATFFYYMGLGAKKALPRNRTALPLLTPDYSAAIPTFVKRYFENLYGRLLGSSPPAAGKTGFCLVLDNYQDVPPDSSFHDMIANGFDMIPEGIHIVAISRTDPPVPFASRPMTIGLLEYGDIRFTFEESKELLRRRIPELDHESIAAICKSAEGWAAGIILMLERARLDGKIAYRPRSLSLTACLIISPERYSTRPKRGPGVPAQNGLFFPVLSTHLAETLTGISHAGRILSH